MFCKNCGTENADSAKFCKECGQPLSSAGEQSQYGDAPKAEASASAQTIKKPNVDLSKAAEKLKGVPKKVLIGVAAAVVALIVIICVAVNAGKTIDLDKYVTFEATGYDGYGKLTATIDWDAIEEKYGDKISFTDQANEEAGNWIGLFNVVEQMESYISIDLDATSGLSNGDEVSYTWNISDDLSKYINCKIKYKDGTYAVSDLYEVECFDAFADLEVEFSDVSPNGRAILNYTGVGLASSAFTVDKSSGLSNGDTIVVTITDDAIESCAEQYGMVPAEKEKEYVVEGLETYLQKIADLDDDSLKSLQQKATDIYNAHVVKTWSSTETLESLTYLGNYLLVPKDEDSWSDQNRLYLVYKVQVRDTFTNGTSTYDQVNDIYWYICFTDIKINVDGTLANDDVSYDAPYNRVTIDAGFGTYSWFNQTWYYYGYSTLDELYKNVVTDNSDNYNHEDNLSEDAIAAT